MNERREYFAMLDRGRWTVAYRNVVPGEVRPGNADDLPETPAMPGVRFLTEGKAWKAAEALQAAYAAGVEAGAVIAAAQ
jgi:hypothetical protein